MHFTRIFLPTISYAPKVSIGITYIPSERRLRAIVPLPSSIDAFRGFPFMIFEQTQLCFSSHYIDDFRGINRSDGSLNAIAFSKVHRREALVSSKCFRERAWFAVTDRLTDACDRKIGFLEQPNSLFHSFPYDISRR